MRDGEAENKAERAPSNRETEATKKTTVSRPTHLGAGSPQASGRAFPQVHKSRSPPLPPRSPPSPFPSQHPFHSPDLPAPRRPRIARLTSRGTLCGPLPARGFPNTEDMATLRSGTRGLSRRAPSSVPARRGRGSQWRVLPVLAARPRAERAAFPRLGNGGGGRRDRGSSAGGAARSAAELLVRAAGAPRGARSPCSRRGGGYPAGRAPHRAWPRGPERRHGPEHPQTRQGRTRTGEG